MDDGQQQAIGWGKKWHEGHNAELIHLSHTTPAIWQCLPSPMTLEQHSWILIGMHALQFVYVLTAAPRQSSTYDVSNHS